jgi:predicted TIM-barrel fold metal-dependent hydrolase
MREDDCVMSRRPAHGAEASSSRAALPASDDTVARLEQEREHINASPAHFANAQAEQALCREFRNHGASLNRALNETDPWRSRMAHLLGL